MQIRITFIAFKTILFLKRQVLKSSKESKKYILTKLHTQDTVTDIHKQYQVHVIKQVPIAHTTDAVQNFENESFKYIYLGQMIMTYFSNFGSGLT